MLWMNILLLTLYTNILSNSFQNSSWRIPLRNWKTSGIQSWVRPLHLFHRHFNHVQYAASFCSKLHEEPYRANKWVGRGQMNPEMHKRRRAGHERPFFPLSLLSSLLVKSGTTTWDKCFSYDSYKRNLKNRLATAGFRFVVTANSLYSGQKAANNQIDMFYSAPRFSRLCSAFMIIRRL